MLQFHIFLAVWGDSYIDPMVKLTLPTLLYEGNIPALSGRHQCTVFFFTRREDETKIRSTEAVRRLAERARVEFVRFDPASARTPYLAMCQAHYLGAVAAKEVGARAIVAAPDAIFANGVLARIGELAEQGKSAVMCTGPRLLQETAAPALSLRIGEGASPIAARELVNFTIDHLHPEMRRFFFDSSNFSAVPATCFWRLGAKGFLGRCFYLHPLMIDFSRIGSLEILKTQPIDGCFLGRGLARWDDIYVEEDSDNIYLCTLTPREAFYSFSRTRPPSVEALRRFAYCQPDFVEALHRAFFAKAIKMHVGDLDDEWSRLEEETAKIAAAVLRPPKPLAIRAGRMVTRISRVNYAIARRVRPYMGFLHPGRNAKS
jgi:hypothetical protein